MRETVSEPPSSRNAAPPISSSRTVNGIDIGGVAEAVSRIIVRQLTVEAERRGGTR
jgi:hypothetical protein